MQSWIHGLEIDWYQLFKVMHHGVTGLVGANGAGKTTFMSIALGLRAPTNGSIRVLDLEPVSDGAKLRSLVSYGPERNILPDEMRENNQAVLPFKMTSWAVSMRL